jgi:predicted DNA-binding transcriptional regulator YafY
VDQPDDRTVVRLGSLLMPRAAGRDQTGPMERLVRLIGALTAHPGGAPAELLLTAVDPPGEALRGSAGESHDEARRKMLSRDLEHLNALGYDVRNVAEIGSEGRYVMRARDNRLQVSLSAQQRGELLRAALAAGLDDMARHLGDDDGAGAAEAGDGHDGAERGDRDDPDGPPGVRTGRSAALDLVQRATARRCRVRFTYKGESRAVDPARVHSGPSGWYLSGREAGSSLVKEFVVSRMSDVELDPPGSAPAYDEPVRPSLDPLSWEVEPPLDVVLGLAAEHRVLVENLLGAAPSVAPGEDGELLLGYRVTNRRVLRNRVYELGTRVRVVSPAVVRDEIIAELRAFVAGAS